MEIKQKDKKKNMVRERDRSNATEKIKMKVKKLILGLDWDRSWCTWIADVCKLSEADKTFETQESFVSQYKNRERMNKTGKNQQQTDDAPRPWHSHRRRHPAAAAHIPRDQGSQR